MRPSAPSLRRKKRLLVSVVLFAVTAARKVSDTARPNYLTSTIGYCNNSHNTLRQGNDKEEG